MKLSILIPVFNEEKTVGSVLESLYSLKIPNITKEIIVVDDGSRDKSPEILKKKKRENPKLIVITHEKNKGKGAAIQTGIKKATGDIILIQDADLEYNPKDIPMLLEPIIDKKAKVVYGTRLRVKPVLFGKEKTPLLLHFFGNKFLSLITTLLYGSMITDMETGYKVFTKNALKGINLKSRSFDMEPEITAKILKKGIRILELDIITKPRGYNEGKKIKPIKDGLKALWTILKYRFTD